jgi:hypothetical protein
MPSKGSTTFSIMTLSIMDFISTLIMNDTRRNDTGIRIESHNVDCHNFLVVMLNANIRLVWKIIDNGKHASLLHYFLSQKVLKYRLGPS